MTESDLLYGTTGKSAAANGGEPSWLGCSAYLAAVAGREDGAPPPVDLVKEKRNGDFVRDMIKAGRVTAVHDVSDGGLIVAIAEMAMASGIGARLFEIPSWLEDPETANFEVFFDESQAQYVLTCAPGDFAAIDDEAYARGVSYFHIGETQGSSLTVDEGMHITVAELKKAHDSWLPDYMAGKVQ